MIGKNIKTRIIRRIEAPKTTQSIESAKPAPSRFKIKSIDELKYQNLLKKNSLEHQAILSREDYCRLNGIPNTAKLFYFNSKDTHIKDYLIAIGWHCIAKSEFSSFADLIYTVNDSPTLYKSLKPAQYINHFENNHLITSKANLHANITRIPGYFEFYPKSFNAFNKDEIRFFRNEFFKIITLKILRKQIEYFRLRVPDFMVVIEQAIDKNIAKSPAKAFSYFYDIFPTKNKKLHNRNLNPQLIVNILILEQLLPYWETFVDQNVNVTESFRYYDNKKFDKAMLKYYCKYANVDRPYDLLSEVDREEICPDYFEFWKTPNEYLIYKLAWIFKIFERYYADFKEEASSKNVWILKPAAKSKGVGLFLSNNAEEISQYLKTNSNVIIQKYVEYPLLLKNQVKFDIRMWVLVSSFSPLKIYYFPEFYLRLCSSPFDLNNLGDTGSHFTNYSVNKNLFEKAESSVKSAKEFKKMLKSTYKVDFEADIFPKIKNIIVKIFQEVQHQIIQRPKSFEVYGFDILIDKTFNPWLLEINLSPACEARTEFLKISLSSMAASLFQLLFDSDTISLDKMIESNYVNLLMDTKTEFALNTTDNQLGSQKENIQVNKSMGDNQKAKQNIEDMRLHNQFCRWDCIYDESAEIDLKVGPISSMTFDALSQCVKVSKANRDLEIAHELAIKKHCSSQLIARRWRAYKEKLKAKEALQAIDNASMIAIHCENESILN